MNSRGRHVVLTGVDVPGLEWSVTGDNSALSVSTAIHQWHVSLIRLPIAQDLWEGREASQSDGGAAYRALVASLVQAASDAGVYILVDLHWSDMGQWGSNVGQHDLPDDNTAYAWHDIATQFANNPAVLFDAYNEPHDTTWDLWRNGGSVKEGAVTYHSPGMQAIVNTIRSTGAKNIIAVGGLGFSYDLSGVAGAYAIDAPNIVYSVHIYPPSPATWEQNIDPVAKNHPILIGEFGADPTNDYSAFMPQIISFISAHHFNASAWCLHPSATPCLINGFNYDLTYNEGTYVYSWLNGGPAPPEDLTASGANGQITLSWQPTPGASCYRVYRAPVAAQVALAIPTDTSPNSSPSYVDPNATAGQTFFYRVTAVNDNGVSGLSNAIGATVGIPEGFPPPSPAFSVAATVDQTAVKTGTAVSILTTVKNTSTVDASALLIDMEVHDANNKQVSQQTVNETGIVVGESKSYPFKWIPAAPGTYSINLYVFGGDWSPKYGGSGNLATVTVGP